MLLFKFLPHGSFFGLMGILKLEIDIAKQLFLIKTQLLQSFFIGLLWHLIFQLFKLVFVDLEVCFDSIGLSVLLVRVLSEEKLKHLLFLSELLHE